MTTHRERLDGVFRMWDLALREGRFATVDEDLVAATRCARLRLAQCETSQRPLTQFSAAWFEEEVDRLVLIAMVTKPARESLKEREGLIVQLRAIVEREFPDRAEAILRYL